MRMAIAATLAATVLLGGCGYHVGGKADLLPKKIKTIAIPSFGNATTRYKLGQRLPAAVTREFITRTRYRIVADPREADAVLNGSIMNVAMYPTVLDPVSGRGTVVQVVVNLQLSLVDRATGNTIFSRPGVEFRERYEISVSPSAYFDESDGSTDRLSRDVARYIVSAILENF